MQNTRRILEFMAIVLLQLEQRSPIVGLKEKYAIVLCFQFGALSSLAGKVQMQLSAVENNGFLEQKRYGAFSHGEIFFHAISSFLPSAESEK